MLRWCWAWVITVALLSGCNDPEDKDQPAKMGNVGDCYAENSNRSIDCSQPHLAETVYVAQGPRPSDSEALAHCRDAQSDYLGQDFNTRLDVQLWAADDESWYRCDVFLRNSTNSGAGYQSLTGSLKGVLEKGVSVDLQSCLDEPYDAAGDQRFVACSEQHVAQELIVPPAIGTLDEPFPRDIAERAIRACNAAASAVDLLGDNHVVRAYFPKNAGAWATGERTADCWVAADKGSLPPVQTTN